MHIFLAAPKDPGLCCENFRPSRMAEYASVLNFSGASQLYLSEQPALNRFFNTLVLLRAENALHFALSKSQANAWLVLEASGNLLPAQLRAACKK